MGWQTHWRVTCERCKGAGPVARTSALAESRALARGWLKGQCYGMALHLCPECVAKGLPGWWPDSTGMNFHWEEGAAT